MSWEKNATEHAESLASAAVWVCGCPAQHIGSVPCTACGYGPEAIAGATPDVEDVPPQFDVVTNATVAGGKFLGEVESDREPTEREEDFKAMERERGW